MATAKKTTSGSKSGAKKNTNTTKKSSTKSTAAKKSAASTKKTPTEPTVNQYRLVGVGLMLLGLMLGLWFAVIGLGVFGLKPTPGQVLISLLAGLANVCLALAVVYLGYSLYSGKHGRLSTWQVTGLCFFLLALVGLLHLPQLADGIKAVPAAWQAGLLGQGGSVCGFLVSLLVCWLPSQTARYIVLLAFLLLGVMLLTDMQVFGFIGKGLLALKRTRRPKQPKAESEAEDDAALAAAAPPKRPAKDVPLQAPDEEPPAWHTERLEVTLPPVITEYSGSRFAEVPRNEYDKITVGDMLGENLTYGLDDGNRFATDARANLREGFTTTIKTPQPRPVVNHANVVPFTPPPTRVYEPVVDEEPAAHSLASDFDDLALNGAAMAAQYADNAENTEDVAKAAAESDNINYADAEINEPVTNEALTETVAAFDEEYFVRADRTEPAGSSYVQALNEELANMAPVPDYAAAAAMDSEEEPTAQTDENWPPETIGQSGPAELEELPSADESEILPPAEVEDKSVAQTAQQTHTAETTQPATPAVRTELVRVVDYQLPPLSLMKGGIVVKNSRINQRIMDDSVRLENVLASFGVKTKVVEVVCGPSIIRYELQPAPGVKISRIVNLADDIALALAARGLRIEAPVPGKPVVGIEVAREETSPVYFKDVLSSEKFQKSKSKISIGLGIDINGQAIVGNLAEMPHLLVAGATGSGKSVCMNTLICSILYKARPDEVKFIMVDPKKVEMTAYVGLPHLGRPVVTDAKKAAQVLKEVVNEMDRRYLVFVDAGVKNFVTYNELPDVVKMPQIVVLIDELADLMMVASKDVEDSICRLAQLARAAGIHLVIATQRPSVDVITGLIKANIPSRIAFAVSSQIDSRTILDMGGAEKLLGKGDMLYYPIGQQKPLRVQGAFLTEEEIHDLVAYCKAQAQPEYLELPVEPDKPEENEAEEQTKSRFEPLFIEACQQVINSGHASASSLQRRFSIGYNRAARLIDTMQEEGIVSAPAGNKRTVLMDMPTFEMLYVNAPVEAAGEEE